MELSEFKNQVIQSVKNNYTANVICPVYPLANGKQSTIHGNGGQAQIDMMTFINGKIAEIQAVEDVINALTDQTILDNFTGNTDAEQSTYVASVLTDLTTDDQKLYVACALRFLQMRG